MNYSVEFELYRYSPYVGLYIFIIIYIYSLQCCALSIENSFYATFIVLYSGKLIVWVFS